MTWSDSGLTVVFGDDRYLLSHEALLAILAAGIVVLLLAFLHSRYVAPRKGGTCRWGRLPGDRTAPFARWRCKTCQVDAYSFDKRPPKACKKALKAVV